jgi:nucleoid-associated protein YgaU
MLVKKSRYRGVPLFAARPDGTTVFPGLRPRPVATALGVVEHEIQAGDRIDHLAHHYYNDDRLWWRIVDANPDIVRAGVSFDERAVGKVLLIPKARDDQ